MYNVKKGIITKVLKYIIMKVDLNIQKSFTPEMKELFEILAIVAKEKTPNTEVFVVGGAVRDLLVGIPSDDIDIMVTTSGKDFAYLVTNYLGSKDPHVIKENPEKSKNLQTVKSNLKLPSGAVMEVDFAQARSEVYTNNSRIPDTKPATASEDMFRRDFTVNSLAFRIYPYPQEIKDFTGKGIQDLISNTLRTPQDPLKTFKEDPLRIFRAIRLSSKYNFTIDPETYSAMKDKSLQDDIRNKLARERSATEIEKMIKGPNPFKAISLLYEIGLFPEILQESLKGTKYEGKMSPLTLDQKNMHHKLNVWEHSMQAVKNIIYIYPEMDGEKKIIMVLAALFHDLGKLYTNIQGESKSHPGSVSYIGHEEESYEIAKYLLKYLKMDGYIDSISKIVREHMRLHSFTEQNGGGSQKSLRKFIRSMGEIGINYLDVLNLSIADAYSKGEEIDPKTVEEYKMLKQELENAMTSLSSTNDIKIKPVLNGNEIMNALGIKPGPQMAPITEFVKGLRDENPDITKEEATRLIKEQFGNPISATDKIASGKDKVIGTICSKHLLVKKESDIKNLLKENKLVEANTIAEDMLYNYSADEEVIKKMALFIFRILLKNPKLRNNKVLQILFDKAQENIFDVSLGAAVLGLLLILDTGTKEEVIKEVASRLYNLSIKNFKKVIDIIPKNKIDKPELMKFLENISENNKAK